MTTDEGNHFGKFGTAVQDRARYAAPKPNPPSWPILPAPGSTDSDDDTPYDVGQRWAERSGNFWAATSTRGRIPSGLYRCSMHPDHGAVLRNGIVAVDELLELPDSASARVIQEIREFWKLEPEFRQRGFLWKRGVLLYGPPGSGKTVTVQQLIGIVVGEHHGIAISVDDPGVASICLQMVRRIEPKRPIVVLLEDLDTLVQTYGESAFLAMLDGEAQVDNIVFVATTNYPEHLDRRFVDRPSRFDAVMLVDMPTPVARRAYLLAKEPSLADNDEIVEWVRRSEGLSIAHLREMIVLVRCYKKSLNQAIARLDRMREHKPSSADSAAKSVIGF